jgi:hypothetical protein
VTTRYGVYDVFTPTTRARANFVPRASVNENLVSALRTPGKQVIVYGETGSGKSTLLQKKLEELYPGHITSRCSVSSTFDGLLLDAFDQLDPFYTAERREDMSARLGGSLSAEYLLLRADVSAHREATRGTTEQRLLPPQLTTQRLGQFLGAARLCWVLEDFHKVSPTHKRPLAQSLKIFSDMAGEYPSLKIIAIGATDTARQVVEYDAEMRNRVAEVLVPLMNDEELGSIIIGGQLLLNVNMRALRDAFIRYSMGVASVCHQLALNACLDKGVLETLENTLTFSGDALKPALERWVDESSDSLKATFERALRRHKIRRFDNTRLILRALARGQLEGMLHGEILRSIRGEEPDYPAGNLVQYLKLLMETERGSLILSSPDGRFRFVDPLHHSYAQAALLEASDHRAENFKYLLTNHLLVYADTWDVFRQTAVFETKSTILDNTWIGRRGEGNRE